MSLNILTNPNNRLHEWLDTFKDLKKDPWIYSNLDEGNTDGPSPHPETKQEQTALTPTELVHEDHMHMFCQNDH